MSDDDNYPSLSEKPWEVNPELLDLPWVKDFDRTAAESKRATDVIRLSEMPKVPINLLLTVMKEAASRPEVIAAYASAPIDGQIPRRHQHLLGWYQAYLSHKYGNRPDPVSEMAIPMCKLALGHYSSLDDPKLIADLMADDDICEDDGVDYG